MNNKLNIEELKYLVPDYISGLLSDAEKTLVENALKESDELKNFYEEVKGIFEFVSNVKFEEPPAQYFNNLLPRIHQKIELSSAKRFAWSNIAAIWKIIIPAVAVLLVFVVYMILKSPENQLTKKEIKPTEEIKKDTPKSQAPEIKEDKKEVIKQEENNVSNKIPEEIKTPVQIRKNQSPKNRENNNENTAQDNNKKEENNDININIQTNDEFASLDPDDISVFAGSTAEGIDEETDSELNKLNNNEKDKLIEDLLQSNL